MGLVLGKRYVGLATADRKRVYVARVLNLYKLTSRSGLEHRLRKELETELARYRPGQICTVAVGEDKRSDPTIVVQHRAVLRLAQDRGLALAQLSSARIKDTFRAPGERRSFFALRDALLRRFPLLAHLRPKSRNGPGRDFSRVNPSWRHRYWFPLFLALGAAVHHLDTLDL